VNQQTPPEVNDAEWTQIKKSVSLLTEHFPNIAIFINWVSEDGETKHIEILQGNEFALELHIEKWRDGDFEDNEDDEDEKIFK
jgi:hypothetical protein